MQCPQCQHENRDQAKFCESCGTRLVRKCAACGTELGQSARYCSECGTSVATIAAADESPAAAPASGFTSPQTYTPQHLAERILTSRGALEGECKQVTVLFADLKGSTELIAGLDPEEARALLDPALQAMMDAVHRYEGVVNQVLGDGIMALFGAPLAHEDHAVRACYAALALQEALGAYGEQVRRTYGVELQARVGLNSGEVVVRTIGNDLHMDYSAIGETTHLAARMEQLATPGTIRLAPATLRLVEGLVQVRSLGPLPVKGLPDPIEVFALQGAAPTRSRLQAAALRGLTAFVGRDAELDVLRRTLEQAGAGRGQLVAVVGEPGVGKSRLVWEFGHSHRTQDWLVLETRSVSYGKATSYLPVIDLLKGWCGIEARDTPRRMREKLTGKLLTLDPALQPTLPALLALLDLPVDDPAWEQIDPPQRRQRTLNAGLHLLLRECREQPALLILEDLHWIDSETQALLDALVERLPGARLLLLVNYRPEYTHGWGSKTYYQQLRLDPLPTASADALLDALLGDDASVAPLKPLLIARTEGNPFFLEESVRTLVEAGALAGERGAYCLTQAVENLRVPPTVQAVLAARIDRLAPEDKRLLQAAAVIGKDVPYPLLQAIAELPEAALQAVLARLQAAEYLYQTTLFPEAEYTFKHALTHEVAYGSLLQERRLTLHAHIVEAIETLYTDRLAENAERLAYHALRGDLWVKAVTYLREAGLKAAARSAHREAVGYLDEALSVLDHLPDTQERCALRIDLTLDLRQSLLPLGRQSEIADRMQDSIALAEEIGDKRRLGWLCVHLINVPRAWERGIRLGERALALAYELGDARLQDTANMWLGHAYYVLGDYRRGIACLMKTVESLRGERMRERFALPQLPALHARHILVRCLASLGEFNEARLWGEELMQLAETDDRGAFGLTTAYQGLGYLHILQGDPLAAIPLLERGLEIAQVSQIQVNFGILVENLGYTYALCGRISDGLPLVEQAAQIYGGDQRGSTLFRIDLVGAGYLIAGRRDQASALAALAHAQARESQERGNEARALHLLGEIAATAGLPDAEQAERCYRDALSLAEELGMRPLAAHCHLGLGTLYQRLGRQDEAQDELNLAAEMYRAMDMPFWLAKAENASHCG